MKQLISLILFFGLAINVSGQDQPTNREEAMAKVSWLIGDWERTGSNGNTQQVSYEWAIENVAMSITTDGGSNAASRIMQFSGVLGFDIKSGKLVGKSFIRRGHIDTEWSFADGKLIEKSTINVNDMQKTTSRFYRKNIVKVRFRGSKGAKKLCFGGRIYKLLGFLSTQMK